MKKLLITLVFCLMCTGCQRHYRVDDPGTGKSYYTTKIVRKSSGAVELKDGRTGNLVTLQNSEVSEVTTQQYNNAVRGVD